MFLRTTPMSGEPDMSTADLIGLILSGRTDAAHEAIETDGDLDRFDERGHSALTAAAQIGDSGLVATSAPCLYSRPIFCVKSFCDNTFHN